MTCADTNLLEVIVVDVAVVAQDSGERVQHVLDLLVLGTGRGALAVVVDERRHGQQRVLLGLLARQQRLGTHAAGTVQMGREGGDTRSRHSTDG